jgi:hypothetical protein
MFDGLAEALTLGSGTTTTAMVAWFEQLLLFTPVTV